jgi:hypothetical protein
MLMGRAPLVICTVTRYTVQKNHYDAKTKTLQLALTGKSPATGSLRIRCWGTPPVSGRINDHEIDLVYDSNSDYATVPLPSSAGTAFNVEVRFP